MTRWGFVRILAVVAATLTAFSALTSALIGDTVAALVFGALAVWNTFMYLSARGQ